MNLNPFELSEKQELPVKMHSYWADEEPTFEAWEYQYEELIESIAPIKWTVCGTDYNYQGNYFYFGEMNGKYYYLTIGYGSCSGCDALQACDTYEDILDLRDDISRGIREFDSLDEFVSWFNENSATEWYDTSEVMNFINLFFNKYNERLKWREEEW